MAKKFKGFNNQQTHQLLKEMGFTGPAQKDEMDAFIASSPSAGSMLGRYTDIARQRVEGGPLAQTGFAEGSDGTIEKEDDSYTEVSRIKDTTKDTESDTGAEQLPEETTEKPDFILKTGTPTPEITDASKALDEAQAAYSKSMTDLTTAQTTLTLSLIHI